ncbi:subtilisin-like protein [Aureobasidium sp. EXF-10727]|nr:subtilisin-like protein [Aureobasidium sp. EXF-10727]
MHLWTPFALFACVSGLLVEKLDHAPHGWHDLGSPSPSTRLNLTVSMALPDERLFEEILTNISTPGHADYGEHLDKSELDALVRPAAIGTNTVLQWLKDSGVTESDIVEDGQWIKLTTDVRTAERMLKTSFDIYGRDSKHRGLLRTLRYEIPKEVAKYVDMVQPTTQFPIMSSKLHRSALSARVIPANCNHTMTPDCLRKLYNAPLPNPSKDAPTHGFIAVAGFQHQYPGSEDLSLFAKEYAPYIYKNFTCVLVQGGKSDSSRGIEGRLDMQYASALGFPVPVNYYYTEGQWDPVNLPKTLSDNDTVIWDLVTHDFSTTLVDLARYLLRKPDDSLPHTLSLSYGVEERKFSAAYARNVCRMYGELGARGVTVLFASGDNSPQKVCRKGKKGEHVPVFPASCPYVTSVGGTMFVNPEVAAVDGSGGFSNFFPRPEWQEDTVRSYLDILGTRFTGLYNSSGRAFPDVSAQYFNYQIVHNRMEKSVEGTSASTPVLAGIVGQVNSALIGASKSPLGFMNPFLYSVGHKAFKDVASGSSKGCGREGSSVEGWKSVKGWDPVTGLGTPNYEKLLSIAMEQQT